MKPKGDTNKHSCLDLISSPSPLEKIQIMHGKIAENLGFCGGFGNKQKKDKHFFDLPELGFKPQIFSNFPTHDSNFHRRKGDEIKSK